jgi:DNA modification methylase
MNKLYYGDNFEILRDQIADESVDLIYIDPPFNSKRDYNIIYDGATAQAEAFKDTWSLYSWQDEHQLIYYDESQRYKSIHSVVEAFEKLLIKDDPSLFGYLVNMAIRLVELHRVLKPTGSFYLHCDPTANHYLKIICDEVFGKRNFRNEIIWCYRGGGSSKGDFRRKHDVIVRYSASDRFCFNSEEIRIPYQAEGLTRTDDSMWGKHQGTEQVYKPHPLGKIPEDWWLIDALNANDPERLGYPTQKPEQLLQRIIKASSNENDVILDAFCGCGTTIAVAQKLNRKWIGIDITFLAIDLIRQRLLDQFYRDCMGLNEEEALKRFNSEVNVFGIPRDIEGVRQLATQTRNDRVRKEYEKWAVFSVGGVYSEVKGSDRGMDGYFYIDDTDGKGKYQKVKGLIQVKSGKVGVANIRDFAHVLEREASPVGFFVTLENPTEPMHQEIARLPKWKSGLGKVYNKIYIITVQDILDGVLPNLSVRRATKQAKQTPNNGEQKSLLKP